MKKSKKVKEPKEKKLNTYRVTVTGTSCEYWIVDAKSEQEAMDNYSNGYVIKDYNEVYAEEATIEEQGDYYEDEESDEDY